MPTFIWTVGSGGLSSGAGSSSTTATSSPTTTREELGDLLLTWSNELGNADLSLVDDCDLATDRGLKTAVLLSLFLDRRAEDDDVPPSGNPDDRRGWWADEFLENDGDRIGSRLWLLDRSKATPETVARAKEYIAEALAWMVEDKVALSIEPTAEILTKATVFDDGEVWPAGSLIIGAVINRPGKDRIDFRFAAAWDHT